MSTKERMDLIRHNMEEERQVRELGQKIGFGRLMQLAQQEWEKALQAKDMPAGGSFVFGPCLSMTVPCGCESPASCEWCCGSGRLTKHVHNIKTDTTPKGVTNDLP